MSVVKDDYDGEMARRIADARAVGTQRNADYQRALNESNAKALVAPSWQAHFAGLDVGSLKVASVVPATPSLADYWRSMTERAHASLSHARIDIIRLRREIDELRAAVSPAALPDNKDVLPDYHGPKNTSDPTYAPHKRAYDVATDALNGRLTNPQARRVLRDALDVADKPAAPVGADHAAPPGKAFSGLVGRAGLYVP